MNRITRMNKLRGVLIDLSGTLHIEDTETPGAIEALKRLRKSDLKLKFVTNTTKESKRVLLSRLHSIGFDVRPDEIFSSLTAARKLIDSKKLRPLLLVDDKAMEEFDGISTDNPNSVVVGLAPDKFDYDFMNQAFRLVLDGADLVAIHKARYYQTKAGLCLGPGPFVQALEFATGRTATVVGKPQSHFFLSSIADWDVPPASVAMIGDDARDDIQGAAEVGMQTFLVQTGKYRPGDEDKISPPPTVTVPTFSDAVELILSKRELS